MDCPIRELYAVHVSDKKHLVGFQADMKL